VPAFQNHSIDGVCCMVTWIENRQMKRCRGCGNLFAFNHDAEWYCSIPACQAARLRRRSGEKPVRDNPAGANPTSSSVGPNSLTSSKDPDRRVRARRGRRERLHLSRTETELSDEPPVCPRLRGYRGLGVHEREGCSTCYQSRKRW
jgi:hypothetical protein